MADPNFFTTPTGIAVIAAGSSFVAGLLGAFISSATMRATLRQRIAADESLAEGRLEFDRQMASRKFEFDKELAERKLELDKRQLIHERRVELAETVFAEFLQVADAIRTARSTGMGLVGTTDRVRRKEETDEQTRQMDMYYMPMTLLRRERALISALMSKQYRSQAVFGAEIGQAFEEIRDTIGRIRISSDALIHSVLQSDRIQEMNRQNIEKYLGDIWDGYSEADRIQPKVDKAIEVAESVFRPILGEEWVR